jgi:hypothetical protein
METIKAFLVNGKYLTAEQADSLPDDALRAYAEAKGMVMPKAPKLSIIAHTNAKGKTSVFVVDSSLWPEQWDKINEGDTVTSEGAATYFAKLDAKRDLVVPGTKGIVRAKK